MNKLIKKLVESLFDDIDDIVDAKRQSTAISNNVINSELKNLSKYNIT